MPEFFKPDNTGGRLLNHPPLKKKGAYVDRLGKFFSIYNIRGFEEMQPEVLTYVGFRLVEKNRIDVSYFYLLAERQLILVPFIYIKNNKKVLPGISIQNFITLHDIENITDVYRRGFSILNNIMSEIKVTSYDCTNFKFIKEIDKIREEQEMLQRAEIYGSAIEKVGRNLDGYSDFQKNIRERLTH